MPLPKPRAVLFDWDDTIVENWTTALTSMNTALTHMGAEPWSDEEARRRSGPSAKDLFRQMFGDRWQEADKVYYDTFLSLSKQGLNIHNHVEDILKTLHGHGVFLGVVSNKRGALLREEVQASGFAPLFSTVVGAGDAPADKPDAAPLLFALGDKVAPGKDIWYVGDSHTDMICAIRAGCSAVLIETKTPPEDLLAPNPPAHRFKKHVEIMEYINNVF